LPILLLQQRIDGAALVHCAVSLGHLGQGQGQVEDFAGVNLSVQDQVDYGSAAAQACTGSSGTRATLDSSSFSWAFPCRCPTGYPSC
jgi:hypothetical protein